MWWVCLWQCLYNVCNYMYIAIIDGGWKMMSDLLNFCPCRQKIALVKQRESETSAICLMKCHFYEDILVI